MLVSILARRDALFWPWRWQIGSNFPLPEIRRRQKEYLAGQVGIAAKADGRDAWKDAHAARQNLVACGHITATHSSGQVQSTFLTPLGEAYARALVGDRLHTFEQAKPVLFWLRELSTQTPVRAVRESVLFCRELVGDPADWEELTDMILPLLTCGVVKADTDTQGRAAYTPTDTPEPTEAEVSVSVDPEADAIYLAAYQSERTVLATATPRDGSEICIPLPATGWGWPCYFPDPDPDSATKNEENP